MDQGSKVVILRKNDAFVTQRPIEDSTVGHMEISIADEDRVVAALHEEVGDAAPDIVIDQEA
ncbi:MAG: hypothetical protein MUQ30_12460 [Anaerolineae bacterium]|nr:hypothetical protein [Anaerolineae bacterium]